MNPYRSFHESYPTSEGEASSLSSSRTLRPTVDARRRGGAGVEQGNVASTTAHPVVFDIRTQEELQRMIRDFPIVVVDVWAAYCNPCKMLLPKYEKIARKYERHFHDRHIIFVKDNIEQNPDLHKPDVRVVPTFFIYVHGQRYHIANFGEIEATVESALNDVMASSMSPAS